MVGWVAQDEPAANRIEKVSSDTNLRILIEDNDISWSYGPIVSFFTRVA
jgi:hypothetical protein